MAGPAIVAVCPAIDRSASAPVSISTGTISGTSERPAGLPSAPSEPVTTARATNGHNSSAPLIVTTRSNAITTASAIPQINTSLTRGSRSASWPAGSASSGTGRNSASPIRPRSKARWWISYTCHPIATDAICIAKPEQSIDVQRRRKSVCLSAGGSTRALCPAAGWGASVEVRRRALRAPRAQALASTACAARGRSESRETRPRARGPTARSRPCRAYASDRAVGSGARPRRERESARSGALLRVFPCKQPRSRRSRRAPPLLGVFPN